MTSPEVRERPKTITPRTLPDSHQDPASFLSNVSELDLVALKAPERNAEVLQLSLADISSGVGAPPSVDVYNGTVEGFEVRGPKGGHYLVTLYRPPVEGAYEDNTNPPEILSLQRVNASLNGESSLDIIDVFRVPMAASDVKRGAAVMELAEAAEALQGPEASSNGTFRRVVHHLQALARTGLLESERFLPRIEKFSIDDAAPSASGLDRGNLGIALKGWLEHRGVDMRSWGSGEAKGFPDLVKEIASGEGVLTFEQDQVYLENRVVLLWLESPDGMQRLLEDHQEFAPTQDSPEGRVRYRRSLGGLPAEKMRPEESPAETVKRLLGEELSIHVPVEAIHTAISTRIEPSMCFPGITKRNTYFIHKAVVPDSAMRSLYVEKADDDDKRTVFSWIQNPEASAARD